MSRNIEIKASIHDLERVADLAAGLSGKEPVEIIQDDTFFNCKSGRLKLRAFPDGTGELIYYRRADQIGPKESFYLISPTVAPHTLRDQLGLACGEIGRVRKKRLLYLVGRTRVHIDSVEALGHFLELEVVLQNEEEPDVGVREAYALMERLGVTSDRLIDVAYLDLLARQ